MEVSKESEVKHKEQLRPRRPSPSPSCNKHRRLADKRPGTKRVLLIDGNKVRPFARCFVSQK